MKPPPLDYTHDRTTLGMACHHRLWTTHMVERHQARHDVTAFGQRKRSNHVGHGMPLSRFGSTHGPITSGVACHHHLWAALTVERRRAWHDIIALGLHTRSEDVRHGMTSPPLDNTQGRQRRAWHSITALGQHTRSDDVGRGMTSPPSNSTHRR